jgi:hypothetical protein
MMAGDGFRPGPLLPGFFGEPVAAWVLHLQCGNKADLVAPEIIISAVRQNFVKVSPDALMNRECGISATCCWGAAVINYHSAVGAISLQCRTKFGSAFMPQRIVDITN